MSQKVAFWLGEGQGTLKYPLIFLRFSSLSSHRGNTINININISLSQYKVVINDYLHCWKASLELSMACLISPSWKSATLAMFSPVEGLNTGNVVPLAPDLHSPWTYAHSLKCFSCFNMARPAILMTDLCMYMWKNVSRLGSWIKLIRFRLMFNMGAGPKGGVRSTGSGSSNWQHDHGVIYVFADDEPSDETPRPVFLTQGARNREFIQQEEIKYFW